MERFGETYAINSVPIAITSASTNYGVGMSIKGAQAMSIIVSMATAPAGQGFSVQAVQGANATVVESSAAAVIAGATASLGSTIGSSYIAGAKMARLALSTATTDAETVIINGTTFTYNSTASGTAYTFGATAGASAAAGVALAMLATMVNRACPKLYATTGASWIDIRVRDEESTSIAITSTGGGLTPSYLAAQALIEFSVAGLNSTSEYVGVVVSSASTAIRGCITLVRKDAYAPARAHGQIVQDINT